MGLSELKRQNRLYAEYYLARPHVFRFLYSYHLKNEYQPDDYDFQGSWDKTFRVMVEDGMLSVEEVSIAARTVIYALHGLLALYFSSNGLTKDALLEELDAVADFVIRRKGRA